MTYTLGPWTYKLKNAANGYIVREGENGMVCDVFMTNNANIAASRARLIAAAPDLLQAAKDIIAWALKHDRGHEGSELLEILSDTQRAITKAKGRE